MTDLREDGVHAVHDGPLAAVTRPLAIAGGLLMMTAAGIVVVSVLLRWTTSQSVSGDFELVQIATALAAFAFLPLCQGRRGNIIVDTFTAWLPPATQRRIDAVWDVVYALAAAVIAWRLAVGAYDTFRTNTVTMVLGIPQGWAIAVCSVIAVLLVLVCVGTAARLIRGRP